MKAGARLPASSLPKGRMEPRPPAATRRSPSRSSARRAGAECRLQPRHAEAKRSERAGKAERWRLPHATARASLQPGKELAAKEGAGGDDNGRGGQQPPVRSEEHTSELQSLMRISYAVFCLNKKKQTQSSLSQLLYNNITT